MLLNINQSINQSIFENVYNDSNLQNLSATCIYTCTVVQPSFAAIKFCDRIVSKRFVWTYIYVKNVKMDTFAAIQICQLISLAKIECFFF